MKLQKTNSNDQTSQNAEGSRFGSCRFSGACPSSLRFDAVAPKLEAKAERLEFGASSPDTRHPAPSTNSGIALIIVMLVVTVLSFLAAVFAYNMKVETKLAQNSNSEQELYWLGRSGVEHARYILAAQMSVANEPYDSLNQKWAGGPGGIGTSNSVLTDITLDNIPLGDGKFSIKITDLDRKVNINVAGQDAIEQALRLVGVDAGEMGGIAGAILDWIDPDDDTHINGAESDFYQGEEPPYFAKNAPVDDLSELLLVKGVTSDIYWGGVATNHLPSKFQSQFAKAPSFGLNREETVYPVGLHELFTALSSGRININTASSIQLQMIPGVDENVAAEIVRARAGPDGADGTEDDTPFINPGEGLMAAGLDQATIGQIGRVCSVRSAAFEVQVDAEVAGYKRQFIAILGRASAQDVQILSFYWK